METALDAFRNISWICNCFSWFSFRKTSLTETKFDRCELPRCCLRCQGFDDCNVTLVNKKTRARLRTRDNLAPRVLVLLEGWTVPGWRYCIWQLLRGASCSPSRSASAPALLHAEWWNRGRLKLLGCKWKKGDRQEKHNETKGSTCNFLNRSACVLLFPCFPCLAFQNCFWAEYLFMGHTLKRQSAEEERHSGTRESLSGSRL